MAWEKTSEHLDEAQGIHTIVLEDKACSPPAMHHLMIHLGHGSCPACGRVAAKDNLDELDPKAHTRAVLAELQKSTDAIKAYGRKHRVPVKKG